MTDVNYSSVSVDDLLKNFERACLNQYDTYLHRDITRFNNEFQILVDIKNELQSRGAEARRALIRLLNNKNKQVRLQAAKFVYAVAKDEAKMCLQNLAAGPFPDDQVFSARMCLRRLEEVPDCLDH